MTFFFLLALLLVLIAALVVSELGEAWARAARATSRCPDCNRHAVRSECVRCERFRCAGCHRWFSWDFGAADDMPEHCDHCWAEAHPEAA